MARHTVGKVVVAILATAILATCVLLAWWAATYRNWLSGMRGSIISSYPNVQGDRELLCRTPYPLPFIKKKIEASGMKRREEISTIIVGWVEMESNVSERYIADTYYYRMWLGVQDFSILYNTQGEYQFISEAMVSSVLVCDN